MSKFNNMKFQQLHHRNPSEKIMFTRIDSPVHMYIYLATILNPIVCKEVEGRRISPIFAIPDKSANKYKNHFFLQEINYHNHLDAPLLTSGYEIDKKITT